LLLQPLVLVLVLRGLVPVLRVLVPGRRVLVPGRQPLALALMPQLHHRGCR
jgi:hypothetical protein